MRGAGFRVLGAGCACCVLGAALGATRAGTPEPTASIRFRDVAASAGVSFRLENSATPQKHLIESVPGGVATLDYDGDGLTDIFFTNGAASPSLVKEGPAHGNRLYRNVGGMTFLDVTEKARLIGAGYSMGVAAADYDNDGDPDLFVTGVGKHTLYRNRGDGTFEEVTADAGITPPVWSVAAGWFDYDRDGWLDLLVVNYVRWSPAFDRFCGDAARGIRVYCHPRFFEGLPNTLYRNRGDGTFQDVSERTGVGRHIGKGMSVAFADYDDNGFADAFVTNDKMPNFVFRNLGDGTFEEAGLLSGAALPAHGRAVSSMGVDARDYDNDGRPDLHVTALASETYPLFRNVGGSFVDATAASRLGAATVRHSGWSNGFIDFDNDGWKDLFTANSHVNDRIEQFEPSAYREANSVFANRAGTFEDVSASAGDEFAKASRPHRGAAFADFNGDGRMDVVVSAIGERAEVWQNVTASAHHWILLKLAGNRSNRDGIGARVRLGTQTNLMTTAVGYASSSAYGVHFGLGEVIEIPRIEIAWPSGRVQVLEKVKADQTLIVREPRE